MSKHAGNKIISSALMAAAIGASSGTALADIGDMRFYLGGDLSYNKYTYDKDFKEIADDLDVTLKSKTPGLGILGGMRFGENFGTEIGYTFLKAAKQTGPNESGKLKASNMYLDLVGYVPVASQIELVGAIGLGRMKAKETVDVNNNQVIDKLSKTGLRVGVGAQYNFDSHWSARTMVRYQKVGGKSNNLDLGLLKKTASFNLGVAYLF